MSVFSDSWGSIVSEKMGWLQIDKSEKLKWI
jgi:hypothetical protein